MEVGKYDWKKIDDDYPRLLSWEKTIGKKPTTATLTVLIP